MHLENQPPALVAGQDASPSLLSSRRPPSPVPRNETPVRCAGPSPICVFNLHPLASALSLPCLLRRVAHSAARMPRRSAHARTLCARAASRCCDGHVLTCAMAGKYPMDHFAAPPPVARPPRATTPRIAQHPLHREPDGLPRRRGAASPGREAPYAPVPPSAEGHDAQQRLRRASTPCTVGTTRSQHASRPRRRVPLQAPPTCRVRTSFTTAAAKAKRSLSSPCTAGRTATQYRGGKTPCTYSPAAQAMAPPGETAPGRTAYAGCSRVSPDGSYLCQYDNETIAGLRDTAETTPGHQSRRDGIVPVRSAFDASQIMRWNPTMHETRRW